MKKTALTDHPINEYSRERWSPRAFADRPVEARHAASLRDSSAIASLLECARWAPSAMNEQPWRFLLGFKGDQTWDRLFSTLTGWNRQWAGQAPLLLLVAGKTHYSSSGKPNNWFAYDCGQAMAHITVEATRAGLYTHQMGGFDAAKATELFGIPEGFIPLAVMAIGYYGNPDALPEELKKRESAPRERKPMHEILFSGTFGNPSPLLTTEK